ncbi:MAG: hypothetical protein ACE37H_14615 [Phycisphaeraceae bacterium]
MNETDTPAPPSHSKRGVAVFFCALVGFALALLAIVGLPLENEVGVGLAYAVVFAVAALSITLIFRVFVKRG